MLSCQYRGLAAFDEVLDDNVDVVWKRSPKRPGSRFDAIDENRECRVVDGREAFFAVCIPILENLLNQSYFSSEGHVEGELASQNATTTR